jgi:hypothetical protein
VSSNPDALREVVDRRAEDLKRDIEAIGERVARPKASVEEKIAQARRLYRPAKAFAVSHPIIASVLAFVVGLAFGYVL